MSQENNLQVKKELSIKGLFKSFGLPRLIAVFFWFAGLDLIFLRKADIDAVYKWQDFVNRIPSVTLVSRTIAGFALLTLIRFLLRKTKYPEIIDSAALFTGSLFFACSMVFKQESFFIVAGVLSVCTVFAVYAAGRDGTELIDKFPFKASVVIISVTTVAVMVLVCVISWAKHMTYNTSCFDMGIFLQMFHSMRKDLSMNTTCERDVLLSHLDVHTSYIFYLLLPFFALFPSAITLFIAQAVLCFSGVIPAVLIAKRHDFKGLLIVFIAFVYIFNVGLLAPCFFHFHENCFLPALLMWLLYAVDSRKIIPIYFLSALVCTVKEDAPLYIICIGLFLLVDEKDKKRIHGGIITLLSLIYFVVIMKRLASTGSAEMMIGQRFKSLVFGDNTGFTGIVKNVLTNPSYFFSLFFSEKSVIFVLQIMIPLLFLPFVTGKIHRYLLILPFIIMNLIVGSGYGYAAQLGYHYTFGTVCLLFYMTILNSSDLKEDTRRTVIAAAAVATLITASALLSSNLYYCERYWKDKTYYQNTEACLMQIPDDASVASAHMFLPHIADRKELYLLDEDDLVTANGNVAMIKDINKYDYYVLSRNDGNTPGTIAILEANGFVLFAESENYVVIYRKAGD